MNTLEKHFLPNFWQIYLRIWRGFKRSNSRGKHEGRNTGKVPNNFAFPPRKRSLFLGQTRRRMIIWSIKIATLLIRTINKTTRRAEFQESNIERYLNAITLSILFVLDNIRVAFIYITSHPSLILHVFITSKQKKINNNKRIIKINFYPRDVKDKNLFSIRIK